MKYTLLLTQRCNLACPYCYVSRKKNRLAFDTARKIVDFAYSTTPEEEDVDIGFFGGEPLLEFDLLRRVTSLIEAHPDFDPRRVKLSVVSNGTVFTSEIADYLAAHRITFGLSCDGPPEVHDAFRRFGDGRGSSSHVERTLGLALEAFGAVLVNTVYHPRTLPHLAASVDYLSAFGVRQIYLNPDFSAAWTPADVELLPEIYGRIADRYVDFYRRGDPHFISLIDSKIAVILRGGYQTRERCRMGHGEWAFTPEGDVYPCERLVGDPAFHLGHVESGVRPRLPACLSAAGGEFHAACRECGFKDYCMNWCGCSNFFSTGYVNRVGPFLCASERAAIEAAWSAFRRLEADSHAEFCDHMAGVPLANSRADPQPAEVQP